MRRAAGFTLIEVLVALSLLAVLAVMSWGGLDGMMRTQQVTLEHQSDTLSAQVGLAQWTLDLDQLADNPYLYPLAWEGQTLRLLRRTGPAQPEGLLVVAWRLERSAGPDQPGRWMRWQSEPLRERQALLQAWRDALSPAPGAAGAGSTADLLPLSSWQVLFYRAGAWGPASPPAPGTAPPRPERPLGEWPEGVRLQLQLPPGQLLSGALQSDWFNPTAPPPANAATSPNANPANPSNPTNPTNPTSPTNPSSNPPGPTP